MSFRIENGVLVWGDRDGDYCPSADEIYSVRFEGRQDSRLDPVKLTAAFAGFSDEPAVPLICLSAADGPGEAPVRCELGGQTGSGTQPAGVRGAFTADYLVVDGRWVPLPAGTVADYRQILHDCGIDGNLATLGQYFRLLRGAGDFRIDDRAAAALGAGALAERLGISRAVPAGLAAEPYPYQHAGIRWLGFFMQQGVGAILADEMGLGKTLQVIATLLAETDAGRRPNLVVCPSTLLENWRRELARFAPSLSCAIHAGARRTGFVDELAATDVVLVSFDTVVADISLFRAISWNLAVLDEAQNIRNPAARRTVCCKELPRRAGLAVTGTPVENRLRDLWSLTDFVLPGFLGPLAGFESRHPDTEEGAGELEPLVSAIMLRRRVEEVARDLPERINIPVPLVMDPVSSREYERIRNEVAGQNPRGGSLAALTRLRLFCAHPWAARSFPETRDALACSDKLRRLLEIMEEIAGEGEKALVFTSYNRAAETITSTVSEHLGIPVGQINGSVPVADRQAMVDRFAAIDGPGLLVLNPKAAGTGLNITAANHVIHYTLEWNPAVEDQASARAYRRGQDRPVTVHRMFYADTVEEVICERMERKRLLAERAVAGSSGEEEDLADIVQALQRSPAIRDAAG